MINSAELDKLRPEVFQFACLMEQRLKENDHKPGWKDCSPDWLLGRLFAEYLELRDVLQTGEAGQANLTAIETVDVANFAMMIADVCGAL